jgi:hypothetical protein
MSVTSTSSLARQFRESLNGGNHPRDRPHRNRGDPWSGRRLRHAQKTRVSTAPALGVRPGTQRNEPKHGRLAVVSYAHLSEWLVRETAFA